MSRKTNRLRRRVQIAEKAAAKANAYAKRTTCTQVIMAAELRRLREKCGEK